ncbi:glycosyltransferase [Anaerolineae bacterium CFX7]|mgnify:CR=1 FL=1|nr:glycosyltransferase [Anaerolineae bacterium CFX7]
MAISCSVGITAHNEAKNIGKLLEALLTQELEQVAISEIIVVASGCTDDTCEIVRAYEARHPRVKLFEQARREGKTSAINLFLQNAREEICVIESGDTIPGPTTIENLIKLFADPKVGMTGAQKIPTNVPDHIVGYMSHLRLQMEHELCLEIPRLGELIAFRKVFTHLPPDVAMDEAFVEALVIKRGLEVRYAPDAVVYNTGPETLREFIMQRRRNYAGHLHLVHKYGYKVSSMDNMRVSKIAWVEIWNAVRLIYTLFTLAFVEGLARLLGRWDYFVKGRKHEVWDIAWTTKRVDHNVEPTKPAGKG